jgi:ubiquinone/menaquinone biosynthesis C-methylase UbiE
MNEKELHEKQYGGKKLISINSFPFLRKIFKKFDLHREDLASSFLDSGGKLLDVGCGSGSLVFKVRERFEEVCGIDISPARIEEANKNSVEKFGDVSKNYFSVCNVNEKIDFSDALFDAVTCIAVIEHIFNPYFVIGEIHRILKGGFCGRSS